MCQRGRLKTTCLPVILSWFYFWEVLMAFALSSVCLLGTNHWNYYNWYNRLQYPGCFPLPPSDYPERWTYLDYRNILECCGTWSRDTLEWCSYYFFVWLILPGRWKIGDWKEMRSKRRITFRGGKERNWGNN